MAKSRKRPPPKRPTPKPRAATAATSRTTSAQPRRASRTRTTFYLGLAALVLAAAVAIGLTATTDDDNNESTTATTAEVSEACQQLRAAVEPVTPAANPPELGTEVQPVTVQGSPLVKFPEGGDIPECGIGALAPTVTGASFDGTPVSITPADGIPTLVLFVAHWCPHCQREVPLLADWIAKGQNPAGVDIVTVSTSVDPARNNYPPSTWLTGENWTTPVLADDAGGSVAKAYGLATFPYYVVLGRDGAVVDRFSGEIEPADLGARITGAIA